MHKIFIVLVLFFAPMRLGYAETSHSAPAGEHPTALSLSRIEKIEKNKEDEIRTFRGKGAVEFYRTRRDALKGMFPWIEFVDMDLIHRADNAETDYKKVVDELSKMKWKEAPNFLPFSRLELGRAHHELLGKSGFYLSTNSLQTSSLTVGLDVLEKPEQVQKMIEIAQRWRKEFETLNAQTSGLPVKVKITHAATLDSMERLDLQAVRTTVNYLRSLSPEKLKKYKEINIIYTPRVPATLSAPGYNFAEGALNLYGPSLGQLKLDSFF